MRREWSDHYTRLDQRDSFAEFDRDGDGVLDRTEVAGLLSRVLSQKDNKDTLNIANECDWIQRRVGRESITIQEYPVLLERINELLVQK